VKTGDLPSYANVVIGAVIVANILSAWVIAITMAKNKGELYDQGPPWMVALSVVTLLLCFYDLFLPAEVSFWGSAALAGFALWGSWVDYSHLVRHYESRRRERARGQSGGQSGG
jgi:hypothetical protein